MKKFRKVKNFSPKIEKIDFIENKLVVQKSNYLFTRDSPYNESPYNEFITNTYASKYALYTEFHKKLKNLYSLIGFSFVINFYYRIDKRLTLF